ncbi:MAG: WD40 repeat domain-containing protein [Candidatus Poribacteria bacterium]|nr:WD40 repeat domain-containing protein [Candidatus Poribacteria bacterium]
MPHPKPAPYNIVQADTIGTTWALPEGAIARLGKGYQPYLTNSGMSLSPDRTYFVVGTRIGLWWYDISSMTPIALWETDRGNICAVDISPDGNWIAIANWDGLVKILDVQSGECVAQMSRIEECSIYDHIAISPDSKWVAVTSRKGTVEVLDMQSGECVAKMERKLHEEQFRFISQLEFSPNSQHVATAIGTQIYLWNLRTGVTTAVFDGKNFAFSANSQLLACENHYKIPNTIPPRGASNISVWTIATGERLAYFTEHNELITSIMFLPCGQFLASSDRSGTLHVWDLTNGVLKDTYIFDDISRIMLFSLPEGNLLVTLFLRETIEVWDIERHEKLQTYEQQVESIGYKWFWRYPELVIAHTLSNNGTISKTKHTVSTLSEIHSFPYSLRFSPNGEMLAVKGSSGGVVLWVIKSKQTQQIFIKDKSIKSFTFLSCRNILAISWEPNVYKVWEVGKIDEVQIAEFSPSMELGRDTFAFLDSRFAFGGKDSIVYLWDIKHSEEPDSLLGHTDHIWSLSFSPDGKRLVSGSSDKTVRLWDVDTREEIAMLPLNRPITTMALEFSPCGRLIAGGMLGELCLWCAEKLILQYTIPQPEDSPRPYVIAFSPCGRYLASGTWWWKGMVQMAIRLWDVETGENLHTFWGHTTDVQSLAFSPDGTLLVSGSFDGTCLLWNVESLIAQ